MKKIKCALCEETKIIRFGEVIRKKHPNRDLKLPAIMQKSKYYKCDKCGLIFQYPLPSNQVLEELYNWENYYSFSLNKLKHFYIKERQHYPQGQYGKRLILMKKYLNKPNPSLLEIGTGHGVLVKLAEETGWKAFGIDTSRRMIEEAQEQIKANVKWCDLTGLSTNHKFDVIAMFDVIEHVRNPIEFINNTKKLMKKDTVMFILTPNAGIDAMIHKENWKYLLPNEHLHLFSKKAMIKLLDKSGLKLIDCIPYLNFYKNEIIPFCQSISQFKLGQYKPWFLKGVPLSILGSYLYVVEKK